MPSRLMIADELNPSIVVDVVKKNGFMEVVPMYDFAYLPSSTGSGVAVSAACYLHAVLITNTGASGSYLVLANQADSDSACPGLPDTSASAIAKIYMGGRGKYIFDSLVSGKLCYRLSGQHTVSGNPNNDGITILYKLVG